MALLNSFFRGFLGLNQTISVDATTYYTTITPAALIANLRDPYVGLGLGTTTYTTFGTVPGQLAVSAGTIVAGNTAPLANVVYSISVLATSGDGKRLIGETFSFTAVTNPTAVPTNVIINEDGSYALNEDGSYQVRES